MSLVEENQSILFLKFIQSTNAITAILIRQSIPNRMIRMIFFDLFVCFIVVGFSSHFTEAVVTEGNMVRADYSFVQSYKCEPFTCPNL